ncbi:MAG: hypothetical protein PHS44_03545 [Candidatus Dojkabacteria bacterium]|nr:hypothetical protein [Candidatus Dojkabacteria bacterium]
MKNFNNQDDAEKLLQQFAKTSSYPDGNFTEQLKTRVLEKTKSNNLFFSFFNMNVKKLALLGSGLFVFLAITLTSGYLLLKPSKSNTDTTTLSGADARKVLQALMQNNGRGSYLVNYQEQTALAAAKDNSSFAESMLYPVMDQYKYYYTKSTTTAGPGRNMCRAYSYVEAGTSETYEYFDENIFNSKYIFKDENGNLKNYSLSTSTYFIEYLGGKYAVKVEYENANGIPILTEESNESNSEETAPSQDSGDSTDVNDGNANDEDLIESIWGDNVKVEEVRTDGKLEYYIITWEEETFCDLDVGIYTEVSQSVSETKASTTSPEEALEKIIRKSWVKPDGYSIYKEETYFDEIKPENLIQTVDYESENSNADFESVKDKFNFDYSIEVRTLTQDDISFDPVQYEKDRVEYLSKVEEFLKSESLSILAPEGKKWLLDSFYVSSIYSELEISYMLDRDFYPEGSIGDQMYEDMKEAYTPGPVEALAYVTFRTKNYENFSSLNIYDKSEDTATILKNMYEITEKSDKTEIEITIDGNKVTADKYYLKESWNVSPSGGEESGGMKEDPSTEETDTYTTVIIVFDYAGSKYIITEGFDSTNETQEIDTVYKSYSGDKPSELKKIMDMIEELLVNSGNDMIMIPEIPEEDYGNDVPVQG